MFVNNRTEFNVKDISKALCFLVDRTYSDIIGRNNIADDLKLPNHYDSYIHTAHYIIKLSERFFFYYDLLNNFRSYCGLKSRL